MKCAIQWVSSFHKRFPRIGQVFSCCVVLINVVFFNTNCDLRRIGPPISSLFAEEYLQKQGYERHVIDAILEYKKIDHETVLKMSKITEPAVRDMLGQNSYLTREERNIFWQDKDDFVRGGVAMNPSITREEILIALGKEKKSSRVFAGWGVSGSALIIRNRFDVAGGFVKLPVMARRFRRARVRILLDSHPRAPFGGGTGVQGARASRTRRAGACAAGGRLVAAYPGS